MMMLLMIMIPTALYETTITIGKEDHLIIIETSTDNPRDVTYCNDNDDNNGNNDDDNDDDTN